LRQLIAICVAPVGTFFAMVRLSTPFSNFARRGLVDFARQAHGASVVGHAALTVQHTLAFRGFNGLVAAGLDRHAAALYGDLQLVL